MDVSEFRKIIKPNIKVAIDGKEFKVIEVIKFRLDDGSYYIKCLLSGGFVLADDLDKNIFIMVKMAENDFKQPFPKELRFKGKKYIFLYEAHAIAEKIWGKEDFFKKGDSERFWDYQAADDSYLSLGVNDQTGERLDLSGEVVKGDRISLPS